MLFRSFWVVVAVRNIGHFMFGMIGTFLIAGALRKPENTEEVLEGDNRIPYCNTSDCQLFLKRLRFAVNKKYNEQIRFYAVSEYGPRTYRPHWHLLLFFNSDELTEVISQYVSESWSYGSTSCDLSRGGSASYVASYVNSSCCLPSLYVQHKEIRPRSLHSKGYGVNNVFPAQAWLS